MTSRSRSRGVPQGISPSSASQIEATNPPTRRRREATLYDAVAGRVASQGFIKTDPTIHPTRHTASSSSAPVAPESVLFRRKHAPQRYEEYDFYFAEGSDRLPSAALPDSDLLKALHCYVADFYDKAVGQGEPAGAGDAAGDWKSMDETALLAMGILMEEMGREVLGGGGDMVFTEGDDAAADEEEGDWSQSLEGKSVDRLMALEASGATATMAKGKYSKGKGKRQSMRERKRRRLSEPSGDAADVED